MLPYLKLFSNLLFLQVQDKAEINNSIFSVSYLFKWNTFYDNLLTDIGKRLYNFIDMLHNNPRQWLQNFRKNKLLPSLVQSILSFDVIPHKRLQIVGKLHQLILLFFIKTFQRRVCPWRNTSWLIHFFRRLTAAGVYCGNFLGSCWYYGFWFR